ncbi:hypothetical protein GQ53DRAFT_632097 [Thozetella sp. PMI_491]|nr:hypothetical protein GQ53DRAFT_632097 [Thozetella sp. PMI_491]
MGIFSKEDSPVLDSYGYKFRLTKNHLTDEQLEPLKHTYDVVGSEALEALDTLFPPPPPRAGWYSKTPEQNPQPDRDTYALLRDNKDKDPKLQKLWDEVNTVPEWVDWDQVKRGQEMFYRYAPSVVAGFAFQGLLATTGASYRPAETLVRTGGHSVKVAKNRLFETFQLILQVTKSLESVQPGGEGFASAVRVRLLHASVRNRILKLEAQRPGYFDVEKFGVPINDLDSMQSVCAFSTNLVWLALPRQGIHVRHQEALDYLALWRWVTYVLGTPHYVLDSPERAFATMESIMYNANRPTKNSRALAYNLVRAMDGVAPIYEPKEFWEAGTRYINGDKLCDAVGLSKPGLYWKAVVMGQCWLLVFVSYLGRVVPGWDRWQIETFRKLFWDYIVESKDGLKGGYKYEFKYVPQLNEKTGPEGPENKSAPAPAGGFLEKVGLVSFMTVVLVGGILSSVAAAGIVTVVKTYQAPILLLGTKILEK